MKKTQISSIPGIAFVILMLFAVFLLGQHTAFAVRTSSSAHQTTKITVPMKVVKAAQGAVINGITDGTCGIISFDLRNNGGGQVDAVELVTSSLGPITSLTYSTYVVNWNTSKGYTFGGPVSPNGIVWGHDDYWNTTSGYITGTFTATDTLVNGTICDGKQSAVLTI